MTSQQSPPNTYLTKEQAAEILGVHPRTLDRWHLQRIGPPRTLAGPRQVPYIRESLDEWMRRRELRFDDLTAA